MKTKDIIILVIIFLAMFTILKIDNEKECKNKLTIKKKLERPFVLEMYE